jgi:hypothetical protein
MSEPTVAETPTCEECGARWLPGDETRWRPYAVDPDEFAWYCPACAAREVDELDDD